MHFVKIFSPPWKKASLYSFHRLLQGGWDGSQYLGDLLLYQGSTKTIVPWIPSSLPYAREGSCIVQVTEGIFGVTGGRDTNGVMPNITIVYPGAYSILNAMVTGRY